MSSQWMAWLWMHRRSMLYWNDGFQGPCARSSAWRPTIVTSSTTTVTLSRPSPTSYGSICSARIRRWSPPFMPSIWSSLRHQSCSFPTLPMSSQWSVMRRVRFQRHALPRHQPIAFFICPIAARHAKLVAYKREMIGLVQAVCHWMPNLGGGALSWLRLTITV
jgi:hypothetical protein